MPDALRFDIGDRVRCRTSAHSWSAGAIVATAIACGVRERAAISAMARLADDVRGGASPAARSPERTSVAAGETHSEGRARLARLVAAPASQPPSYT